MNSGTHCENSCSMLLFKDKKQKRGTKSAFDLLQNRKGEIFRKEQEKKNKLSSEKSKESESQKIKNISKCNQGNREQKVSGNYCYTVENNMSFDRETMLTQQIDILKNQLSEAGIVPVDEIVPYEMGKEKFKNCPRWWSFLNRTVPRGMW